MSEKKRTRGLYANRDAIVRFRRVRGWTQERLAEEADCETRTIRNAENGRPVDSTTLQSIADAMEMGVSRICSRDSSGETLQKQNIEIIRQWSLAVAAMDLESVVSFHHPETRFELPGTSARR